MFLWKRRNISHFQFTFPRSRHQPLADYGHCFTVLFLIWAEEVGGIGGNLGGVIIAFVFKFSGKNNPRQVETEEKLELVGDVDPGDDAEHADHVPEVDAGHAVHVHHRPHPVTEDGPGGGLGPGAAGGGQTLPGLVVKSRRNKIIIILL